VAGPGRRRLVAVLALLTVLVLALSAPRALHESWQRGGVYLFSAEFLRDLPRRLSGPGRLRFIIQPLMASLIGFSSGRIDRRQGHPPFVRALVAGEGARRSMVRDAWASIVHLLLLGVLLDCVAQWLILGKVYPVPALILGPVLIAVPYTIARVTAWRLART
jgi:hypothetical protein